MQHRFGYEVDPARPGGLIRRPDKTGRFIDIYGEMRIWPVGENRARLNILPSARHLNIADSIHGGFMLAVVDHSLFVCPMALGIEGAVGGVTIDVAAQFLAPAFSDKPLEVEVEVLRETRRMIFMRGLIDQDGQPVLSFTGTIKKASIRP